MDETYCMDADLMNRSSCFHVTTDMVQVSFVSPTCSDQQDLNKGCQERLSELVSWSRIWSNWIWYTARLMYKSPKKELHPLYPV